MNISETIELKHLIDQIISSKSRNNQAKPSKYWYPLSLASYGSDEILEALDAMCSFRTSMAEKTLLFEKSFSEYQNCLDSVMVNSGSSADLLLSLLLSYPGDRLIPSDSEIIIPIVTWPTQVWSVMMAHFKVKFVDCDPETLNIDLDDLEDSITEQTKAIFLVHLMGNPCNMDKILEIADKHNLLIIEDCCEALGATWDNIKVGNFGIGASFSCFFSHHFTTMEGGIVAVNSAENLDKLRILRAHGWLRNTKKQAHDHILSPDIDPRYAFVNWGLNVRPTEVQAAFGLRQLEKLEEFNKKRAVHAEKFRVFLKPYTHLLSMPKVYDKAKPSWLGIPLMISPTAPFSKQSIINYLEDIGIETRPIVTGNLAKHPVAELFSDFGDREYNGANQIHSNGFYIGLSPIHTDENLLRVLEMFDKFLKNFV